MEQVRQVKQEVRKSIVRILFHWKAKPKDERFMVIPGIILSINDDGSAIIAANSTFFGVKRLKQSFVVNFPNATGYEEGQELAVSKPIESACGFHIFSAKPRESGYIKAVRFETQPVRLGDPVHCFIFPREGYITPTAYVRGSVIGVRGGTLLHDCCMHSYAYLGSPLFNLSGDLVGITYLDEAHSQAWTVWKLRSIFGNWKSTIVFKGIEDPTGAAAQVEDPIAAAAQVEDPTGAAAQVEE